MACLQKERHDAAEKLTESVMTVFHQWLAIGIIRQYNNKLL